MAKLKVGSCCLSLKEMGIQAGERYVAVSERLIGKGQSDWVALFRRLSWLSWREVGG